MTILLDLPPLPAEVRGKDGEVWRHASVIYVDEVHGRTALEFNDGSRVWVPGTGSLVLHEEVWAKFDESFEVPGVQKGRWNVQRVVRTP